MLFTSYVSHRFNELSLFPMHRKQHSVAHLDAFPLIDTSVAECVLCTIAAMHCDIIKHRSKEMYRVFFCSSSLSSSLLTKNVFFCCWYGRSITNISKGVFTVFTNNDEIHVPLLSRHWLYVLTTQWIELSVNRYRRQLTSLLV